MNGPAVAILIAFGGYSLLNIGQAVQKMGLSLKSRRPAAGWGLWTAATLGTGLSVGLVFLAIQLGSVAIVGAMSGTGLAALAVFSHFVMDERISWREIGAIALIIAGAVTMGFGGPAGDGATRTVLLYVLLAAGTVAFSVLWILLRRGTAVGVVIGAFSGFLGAYSQLFQKHSAAGASISDGIGAFLGSVVMNPVAAVWVALSVMSMVILQFSYRHADAIQIIPSFTANFIVVPVIGGAIIFGETLAIHQWIGIAVMLPGTLLLAKRRGEKRE